MKRKYIIPVMASLLTLGACDYNEDNFEGLDEMTRPTNVTKIAYTLTDADYEEMGGGVKSDKYFSADNQPDDFIPKWLANKYFTVDQGSSANITYRIQIRNDKYRNISYLSLADDDYNIVHGDGFYAPYLNKNTEGKMYKILNEKWLMLMQEPMLL